MQLQMIMCKTVCMILTIVMMMTVVIMITIVDFPLLTGVFILILLAHHIFLNISSSRLARSGTLSTLRASDHAIISVCFCLGMIAPPASRPVPLEVMQTPYFKSLLPTCLHLHHWHTFPVAQLFSELNSLIEDVASHTKDVLQLASLFATLLGSWVAS